jgi:hypothetical protein
MMPILGVCGDSYMSATQNGDRSDIIDSEGKHFTEILAKNLGYKYRTLARAASSNSCIRMQIEQLIEERVDFVIIGTTRSDRIEYPVKNSNHSFEPFYGIYNIKYDTHPDQSSLDKKFNMNTMFSETITNVLAGNYGYQDVRDEEQRESIKRYFMDIYDHHFRELQDTWIIADGIRSLIDAKIPYVILLHDFFYHHKLFINYNSRHILQGSKDFDPKLIPYTYENKNTTRRWHTTDEDQVDIAELMCNHMKTNNLLVWS